MEPVTDLVVFLLARLDDDEHVAQAAGDRRRWPVMVGAQRFALGDLEDHVTHIARHDPARVLADIAAKRAIVALHEGGDHECREMHAGVYSDDWPQAAPWGAAGQPWRHTRSEYVEGDCETLKLLALPFADHPDYDQSWKP